MQQELLIKAGVKYKISHIMVALRENAFFLTFVFTLEMQFDNSIHLVFCLAKKCHHTPQNQLI